MSATVPNRVGKRQVNVLVPTAFFNWFDWYCKRMGHKKSSLIARLIREFLYSEKFPSDPREVDEWARQRRAGR